MGTALDLFAQASHRLRRKVPFDAAVWRAVDPFTGLPTAPILGEHVTAEGCAAYWDVELGGETVNAFADLARAATPAAGLRESTGGLPARSALYRDFMRPRGLDDEMRAVLRVDGLPWGQISLFRHRGEAPFTEAETRLVAELSGPLAKRLRAFATPSADTHAAGGPGLLLFDREGRLLSVNDEARRHLDDMPPGPAADTPWGVRIPAWVHSTAARAKAVTEGRAEGGARIRIRGRSGRWMVCHASCLRGPDGRVAQTAVVVEDAPASEVAPLIVRAYGLTARELEITEHLSRGLGTGEIAAALFISPHTVRDHVKAVFGKLGVSSRRELVATLFTEHYAPLGESGTVRTV
ncbi:helix-turn-helix transcriptional regulator [Phytomonospora sp. NPDC050363]|uniref:helix-turn-helix transcriptional regulator n=1 Tax=Phytomonospora sp. NPDC050363 TaxID=3155642 RepID=UPI0033E9FA44